MERLTEYEIVGGHGHAVPTGDVDQAMMRLAAYEDTGLTPKEVKRMSNILMDVGIDYNCSWEYVKNWLLDDRLRELFDADKDGRLVVLPCKVGDTVWITGSIRKLYGAKVRTFFCGNPSAVRGTDNAGNIQMVRTTECDIPIRDFGKSVFLTREEEEKALEAME